MLNRLKQRAREFFTWKLHERMEFMTCQIESIAVRQQKLEEEVLKALEKSTAIAGTYRIHPPIFRTERMNQIYRNLLDRVPCSLPDDPHIDDATTVSRLYNLARTWFLPNTIEAENLVGLKGKSVLEIGGILPRDFVLDHIGAKQWISVLPDVDEVITAYQDKLTESVYADVLTIPIQQLREPKTTLPHMHIRGFAEDIPESFYGYFDVIYCTNSFEHVLRFGSTLSVTHSLLKPGGKLYAKWAPIWSSWCGYHNGSPYQGRDGRYHELPQFCHLILSPFELYSLLREEADAVRAAETVRLVFHDPDINRFFVEDYMQFFDASPFNIENFDLVYRGNLRDNLQLLLESRHPGKQLFDGAGLRVVCRK